MAGIFASYKSLINQQLVCDSVSRQIRQNLLVIYNQYITIQNIGYILAWLSRIIYQ
ncbi:hypothetical protein NIES39_K02990 [Arthrospira platensis NIES-39]|nr:hypothetical protein NIES39_K02990 [Arthrospira platensis NIES-39]